MTETRPMRADWLHASLPVTDLDAAAAFLCGTFGFVPSFGPVDLGDAFARLTGTADGTARLMQLSSEGQVIELIETGEPPGGWAHVALAVPDLATALQACEAAGAQRAGDIVAFEEGRSAYLRTPGGAVIELEELHA